MLAVSAYSASPKEKRCCKVLTAFLIIFQLAALLLFAILSLGKLHVSNA